MTSSYRGTRKLLVRLQAKEKEPIKYHFSYASILCKEGHEIGYRGSEALEDTSGVKWFGLLPSTKWGTQDSNHQESS